MKRRVWYPQWLSFITPDLPEVPNHGLQRKAQARSAFSGYFSFVMTRTLSRHDVPLSESENKSAAID